MDMMRIVGGTPLQGQIRIAGAKNAALPLMAIGLLSTSPLILENVPDLTDVETMTTLLIQLGVNVHRYKDRLVLQTPEITSCEAKYDIVKKMRASFLVLGPLVARYGEAKVSLPGGCALGPRPVNFHLEGLQALGVSTRIEDGYVYAKAHRGIRGGRYNFPINTANGTMNLVLAAALCDEEIILENVALEPEVGDVLACLKSMGVRIEQFSPRGLCIKGNPVLKGAYHRVLPDRIEMGTYMIAAAITRGDITLLGGDLALLPSAKEMLLEAGAQIESSEDGSVRVWSDSTPLPLNLETAPYPGLPTDLQAQFMALCTLAQGQSTIIESIFENRFMHVCELARMGAHITVRGSHATIEGVPHLTGAPVMATDIRASAGLILAALAARGETVVDRIYHLDRGYERLEEKLSACGANILRIPSTQDVVRAVESVG